MGPKKIFLNDRNYLHFDLDDDHIGEYMCERVQSCSLRMCTLDCMQVIKTLLKNRYIISSHTSDIGTIFKCKNNVKTLVQI